MSGKRGPHNVATSGSRGRHPRGRYPPIQGYAFRRPDGGTPTLSLRTSLRYEAGALFSPAIRPSRSLAPAAECDHEGLAAKAPASSYRGGRTLAGRRDLQAVAEHGRPRLTGECPEPGRACGASRGLRGSPRDRPRQACVRSDPMHCQGRIRAWLRGGAAKMSLYYVIRNNVCQAIVDQ